MTGIEPSPPIQFTEVRVQQTDKPKSISCTGSQFCVLVAPELFDVDPDTGLCTVKDGKAVEIGGASYSSGVLAPENIGAAAFAAVGCDSEAVHLIDTEGRDYSGGNAAELLAVAEESPLSEFRMDL